jgi:tetratricopeptide (TPR) repeat protein
MKGDEDKAYKLMFKGFLCSPGDKDISTGYYRYGYFDILSDEVIHCFEKVLRFYPDNKQLHYLLIDLLIRSQQYHKAMMLIEKSIIIFGKEDGIIDAALNIRGQLGPIEGKNGMHKKKAVVEIDHEIDNFECFIYDLKMVSEGIDFVDNGRSPNSKNIAAVFGASIVPERQTSNDEAPYQWEFKHDDVVNWLCCVELKNQDRKLPTRP